jgi:hypothetical protein
MTSPQPPRRLAPLAIAALSGALLAPAGCSESADAEAVEIARSVCDAHQLRARKAEDPSLEIEIPREFDTPWPTAEACLSYERAGDPQAPGPLQPIAFSHKHHAGTFEIECRYCHSGTDQSQAAGVPSVEVCMGCHAQFPTSYDELEGIRTLKRHWGIEVVQEDGRWKSLPRDPSKSSPIEWEKVYLVPEHVRFRHNRHVAAEIECQRCHGPVEEMDKLYVTEDVVWWPWLLPSTKPEMGWCIQCHREKGASQDCLTCHY